jgi:hypothetical protein
MGYHLETFGAWLREAMSLSNDIEILIDRAAIPKNRKRRPTTRWDHLAKEQSFSMPKVPSRRRLGDTIEEDTATENSPLPTRIITQTLSYPPRGGTGRRLGHAEGAARPGMVKHTSLRSLPRQTIFSCLTEDEQMQMPRLVKQSSFKSIPRGLCDDNQLIGSSLPNPPSRPSRAYRRSVSSDGLEINHRPKLPVRTDDSDDTINTLSSMLLSSRGALIGDDEKGGNGTDRRWRMAQQNSLTMLRRPARTFDSEDEMDERTDTLSSMPRLVKQTSFTVARLQGKCSQESMRLLLISTLTQALELNEDVTDDDCEERDI